MNINLSNWHAHDDGREHLNLPFNVDGRTVATNGQVMISIPLQKGHPDIKPDLKERITSLLDINGEYTPLNTSFEQSEKIQCNECHGNKTVTETTCNECDGDGVVHFENDFSNYECDCDSCNGNGKIRGQGDAVRCPKCDGVGEVYKAGYCTLKINDVWIQEKYYDLLLTLDDVTILTIQDRRLLCFKSGDAYGVVMGCRSPDEA